VLIAITSPLDMRYSAVVAEHIDAMPNKQINK